jgi:hypothetical protein
MRRLARKARFLAVRVGSPLARWESTMTAIAIWLTAIGAWLDWKFPDGSPGKEWSLTILLVAAVLLLLTGVGKWTVNGLWPIKRTKGRLYTSKTKLRIGVGSTLKWPRYEFHFTPECRRCPADIIASVSSIKVMEGGNPESYVRIYDVERQRIVWGHENVISGDLTATNRDDAGAEGEWEELRKWLGRPVIVQLTLLVETPVSDQLRLKAKTVGFTGMEQFDPDLEEESDE